MPLRDYQEEFLNNVASAWDRGCSRQLAVAPTASGKTVMFANLPERLNLMPWEQMMVLVHRDELVKQSAAKLKKYNPTLDVQIEQASLSADVSNAHIIVASVQTLGLGSIQNPQTKQWSWNRRLSRFDPERMRVIVVDESHHAAKGSTYSSILRYFGVYKPESADPNTLLLGVTATPKRPDGIGLEVLFDDITFQREIRQMINAGWLANIKAYRVDTTVDISEVDASRTDLDVEKLSRTVNLPERNRLIVRKYQELCEGMRGVAFTVDVQHSTDLAQMFNDMGVPAAAISGETKDRGDLLKAFTRGELKVLCSCGVLNEGWDDPGVGVGLMARPTKSALLYQQQVGRILRPCPAPEDLAEFEARRRAAARVGETLQKPWVKPYGIIIDFCDVSGQHQLNTVPTLFGLRPDFKMSSKKLVTEELDEIDRIVAESKVPVQTTLYTNVRDLKAATTQIDLLAKPVIPEEVRKYSQLAWVSGATGAYQLSLEKSTLRISSDTLGRYEVSESSLGVKKILQRFDSLDQAFQFADRKVPADRLVILAADARWRYDKPSEAQLDALWKVAPKALREGRKKEDFIDWAAKTYTKGEVSTLIDQNKKERPAWLQRKIDEKRRSQPTGAPRR